MELQTTSANAIGISDAVFAVEFNESLVHQAVTTYLSGARAGTKAQKTRAQVSGGNSKPWRQKGTGRARAGSTRSPLWRGGGKVFAAVPRDHARKINKKMYRGALRSIFSELIRQQRLIVVEQLAVNEPKTRSLLTQLKALNLTEVLIVTHEVTDNLLLAARNLYQVGVSDVANLSPVNLVGFEKILVTTAALKQIEEKLL